MSETFNLTQARRNLMRSVERGEVTFWPSWGQYPHRAFLNPPGGRQRTVTARVQELERAGLIRCAPPGKSYYSSRRYWLTDAGRAVLAGESE